MLRYFRGPKQPTKNVCIKTLANDKYSCVQFLCLACPTSVLTPKFPKLQHMYTYLETVDEPCPLTTGMSLVGESGHDSTNRLEELSPLSLHSLVGGVKTMVGVVWTALSVSFSMSIITSCSDTYIRKRNARKLISYKSVLDANSNKPFLSSYSDEGRDGRTLLDGRLARMDF